MDFSSDLFSAFSTPTPSSHSLSKRLDENSSSSQSALSLASNSSCAASTSPLPTFTSTQFDAYQDQQTERITCSTGSYEITYPPNWQKVEEQRTTKQESAMTFPFPLDNFQTNAITCIEKNQSVLVSAHTSAGKTVVAQYAIAQALKSKSRVIYTSPIKALSNQKYRELSDQFQDVGLLTGDTVLNPNAGCLVMTTEIVREMLYQGSMLLSEMSWIIFDEIHYMGHKERGVVWEETIILLPDSVRYVFLSATLPNSLQLAQWVSKLHGQPVALVSSDFRPTPLCHYLFPCGGEGLYLIYGATREFLVYGYTNAMSCLTAAREGGLEVKENSINSMSGGSGVNLGGSGRGRGGKRKRSKETGGKAGADILRLVQLIISQKMDPVILFNFSKQECEVHAMTLSSIDCTDSEEKQLILTIFENATSSLSTVDRQLPQIQNILPLLLRGIGLHHGGLLPVLKEVTEILFAERLLKVLIATETFAMGINMPARSVVFTSLSKFDGDVHRTLTAGEYTQMSGRAGRRGLDEKGFAIAVLDETIEEAEARQLVCGEAAPLDSAFALRYSMLLNITRMGSADPEFLMRRSFRQFQLGVKQALVRSQLLEAQSRAKAAQAALAEVQTEGLEEYFALRSEIELKGNQLRKLFYDPIYVGPFLDPGRVVEIRTSDGGGLWGIILKYYKKRSKEFEQHLQRAKISCSIDPAGLEHMLDVLLPLGETCTVDTVSLKAVLSLSSIKLFLPKEIHGSPPLQNYTLKSVEKLQESFPDGLPPLDPFADLGFPRGDVQMLSLVSEIESLEERLFKMPIAKRAQKSCLRFGWYEEQKRWSERALQLEKQLQIEQAEVSLVARHKGMLTVLRRLGYLTLEGVVSVKGKIACLISTCDEIAACELLMHGGFQHLSAPQICALLSCIVTGPRPKKEAEGVDLNKLEGLAAPLKLLKDVVTRIGQVMVDARVLEDGAEYVDSFQPLMAEVVFHWASGASFQEVCSLTDAFEGQIVRSIRHVGDVLRQMSGAAKLLGEENLEASLAQAANCLQRDIVFACSLYL